MKNRILPRLAAAFLLTLALFLSLLPRAALAALPPEEDGEPEAQTAVGETAPADELPELTEEERKANLRAAAAFLRDEMGMNDAVCAAILANIDRECSWDPRATDYWGLHRGVFQWNPDRWDKLLAFCEENELDPMTMDGQLRYFQKELAEDYPYLSKVLGECADTEDGAVKAQTAFCELFEVPTDMEGEQEIRSNLVRDLYWPMVSYGSLDRSRLALEAAAKPELESAPEETPEQASVRALRELFRCLQ